MFNHILIAVIHTTYRDMLYQLDMDLGLLSNLTWETNASLLSMCTPSTVSMASLYMLLLTLYSYRQEIPNY